MKVWKYPLKADKKGKFWRGDLKIETIHKYPIIKSRKSRFYLQIGTYYRGIGLIEMVVICDEANFCQWTLIK